MFDDLLRELKRLEDGVKISIDLEIDDNGYLDRRCSSPECGSNFKVMFDDWRNIVQDEIVYCPLCRHDATSSEWNTPEQDRYIKEHATAYMQQQIGRALTNDSRQFNSRQTNRKSLIKLSMSYRPGHIPIPVPASASDIMTQEFTCEECNCRYSSVGAAFFCPACGHNSILETFYCSIDTVKKTLEAIPTIHKALLESIDENLAQNSVRQICENGLVKIISSFQRYTEARFLGLSNASQFKIRRNLFQNLNESDSFWRQATSTGYTDILSANEFQSLLRYFQQRHLLSHQDGIVDQQYINRASFARFDVGQRLIVTEASVLELGRIIEKLATGISKLTAV